MVSAPTMLWGTIGLEPRRGSAAAIYPTCPVYVARLAFGLVCESLGQDAHLFPVLACFSIGLVQHALDFFEVLVYVLQNLKQLLLGDGHRWLSVRSR